MLALGMPTDMYSCDNFVHLFIAGVGSSQHNIDCSSIAAKILVTMLGNGAQEVWHEEHGRTSIQCILLHAIFSSTITGILMLIEEMFLLKMLKAAAEKGTASGLREGQHVYQP